MLLKKGSRGQEVAELQQALGIDADGVFSGGTRTAVESYQQKNGLLFDGVVGPQILAAIREANATTDNSEKGYSPYQGLVVNEYFLPKGGYRQGRPKRNICFCTILLDGVSIARKVGRNKSAIIAQHS